MKYLTHYFFVILFFCQQNIIAEEKAKEDKFRFPTTVELGITIDDIPAAGPDAPFITRQEISDKIIKNLQNNKIPEAYGFLNGILLFDTDLQKKILTDWKNSGHLLANHSFSHLNLAKVSAEEYIKDIKKNDAILVDYATTISELKVFRYP